MNAEITETDASEAAMITWERLGECWEHLDVVFSHREYHYHLGFDAADGSELSTLAIEQPPATHCEGRPQCACYCTQRHHAAVQPMHSQCIATTDQYVVSTGEQLINT